MLTVHVGLHKTGSTSIQTVLSLEKGHIRRKQLYLPWGDLFVTDGHVRTCNVHRIRALSQRGWHVVVSSEGALGSMAEVYPRARQVAAHLASVFRETPIRLVMYLRPHHHWAESAFFQYRKEGGTNAPDHFASSLLTADAFEHASLIRELEEVLPLGGLIVRPYDHRMDVVGDFFEQADLGDVPPAFDALRANVSGVMTLEEPRSPFSPAMQRALREHFQTDWGQLVAHRSPAVSYSRGDFVRVLDEESALIKTVKPMVELGALQAAGVVMHTAPPSAVHSLRERQQKLVFALRHGPRQLLLRQIVRRDGAGRHQEVDQELFDANSQSVPLLELAGAGGEGGNT